MHTLLHHALVQAVSTHCSYLTHVLVQAVIAHCLILSTFAAAAAAVVVVVVVVLHCDAFSYLLPCGIWQTRCYLCICTAPTYESCSEVITTAHSVCAFSKLHPPHTAWPPLCTPFLHPPCTA